MMDALNTTNIQYFYGMIDIAELVSASFLNLQKLDNDFKYFKVSNEDF